MGKDRARAAWAILAGVLVAGLTVAIVESAGHAMFPPPAGLDPSKPDDLARLYDVLEPGAMAMVVVAWFLGSFAGGCTAIALSKRALPAWIVGGVIAALALWTSQIFPHPAWMVGSALVLPFLAALIATKVMARKLAA